MQVEEKGKKPKGRHNKSIFARADNVSCLSAMVYYGGENNFCHILWLGTTLDPPPIDSKHSSWRSVGLASFLVAVLVKKHLCQASEKGQSTITVQASANQKQAVSFYRNLGFMDITSPYGGVPSLLPSSFANEAASNYHLWIASTDDNFMICLRLREGRIRLWQRNTVDSDEEDDGLAKKKSGGSKNRGKTYVCFPFECSSTKKMESCCDRLHVLNSFCPGRLPLTDRAFVPQRNCVSGGIYQAMRIELNDPTTWIRTDGTSFLYAWLTRSKESCVHVQVVPTSVATYCASAQKLHVQLMGLEKEREDYTPQEEASFKTYLYVMGRLERYFEKTLDMFERKFILFERNDNNQHWLTLVSVNAGDIAYPHLSNAEDPNMSGYLLIDSLGAYAGELDLVRKAKDGHKWEITDPYPAESGFKFFLNLAYNYHTARAKAQGEPFDFRYHEEPFGPWDAQGTKTFPQLVFDQCGILKQENTNDCGLAAIGNAFAFVNSFKDVPFLKRDMVPYHASRKRNTHDDYFATIPQSHRMASFWTNLLEEVSTRKDTIWAQADRQRIWKMLRWEFIILLDRLALLSCVSLDERYRVFARMKEHYRLPYTLIPLGVRDKF